MGDIKDYRRLQNMQKNRICSQCGSYSLKLNSYSICPKCHSLHIKSLGYHKWK